MSISSTEYSFYSTQHPELDLLTQTKAEYSDVAYSPFSPYPVEDCPDEASALAAELEQQQQRSPQGTSPSLHPGTSLSQRPGTTMSQRPGTAMSQRNRAQSRQSNQSRVSFREDVPGGSDRQSNASTASPIARRSPPKDKTPPKTVENEYGDLEAEIINDDTDDDGFADEILSDLSSMDPTCLVIPTSTKAHAGVARYKDFIRMLPVHLSKMILGYLDQASLNNCVCVSKNWRGLAEEVHREHYVQQALWEEVMLMQVMIITLSLINFKSTLNVFLHC